MKIQVKKLYDDVVLPQYQTEGAAGMDLIVHGYSELHSTRVNSNDVNNPLVITQFEGITKVIMNPHERLRVTCGFAISIPKGYELQIRARSGNSIKKGLCLANGIGTVDSDYRGEIGAILLNSSEFPVEVCVGDRVAQAVLAKHETVEFDEVSDLDETVRGTGGLGSTGYKSN